MEKLTKEERLRLEVLFRKYHDTKDFDHITVAYDVGWLMGLIYKLADGDIS